MATSDSNGDERRRQHRNKVASTGRWCEKIDGLISFETAWIRAVEEDTPRVWPAPPGDALSQAIERPMETLHYSCSCVTRG